MIVQAGESPLRIPTAVATDGVPAAWSIVMSTPLAGAGTPALAKEFRMFSTDAGVREVQPPQASPKQFAEAPPAGAHTSKTFAGKVVSPVQPYHA